MPRQAASVILLRGGADSLEVLLVKRNPARLHGRRVGVPRRRGRRRRGRATTWPTARRAVRELAEEADVTLTEPDRLVKFSRWITPAEVKTRFDTHFFLAPSCPRGHELALDGGGDGRRALGHAGRRARPHHARGEILLVFPTIKHLEQLGAFSDADALLEYARGREVGPVEPRVLGSGETARILLPGDPGYDSV